MGKFIIVAAALAVGALFLSAESDAAMLELCQQRHSLETCLHAVVR